MEKLQNLPLSDAVLEVPCEDGALYPFAPEEPVLTESGRLLVPLSSEHTEAGRGLVRALWFHLPVFLSVNRSRWLLRPWRCHIVGEAFTGLYQRAKARDKSAEVAAVWELEFVRCEETGCAAPEPRPLHQAGVQEVHLDHPSLHGASGGV